MFDKPQMEIPEQVRQLAERNVEQARAAYSQFMDMMRQAQTAMSRSTGDMAGSVTDLQMRMMRFGEQNMEAGFQYASELARARDLKEYLEIQTKHAQRQMQTYAQQAQELGRLVSELAQKAQPRP